MLQTMITLVSLILVLGGAGVIAMSLIDDWVLVRGALLGVAAAAPKARRLARGGATARAVRVTWAPPQALRNAA